MPSITEDVSIGNLGSLQTLPDSFKWKFTATESLLPPSSTSVKESIPVIDLSDPDITNLLGNACKTWGAFQIVNHGISQKLLDDIESLSKTLFDMPSQRKLEAASSDKGVGGYGEPRISPFFEKKMWSEGFTIADDSYRDHFITLWPHDYTKNCGIIEEYKGEMGKLASRLLSCILGSLGVTMDDIEWAHQKHDNSEPKVAIGAIRLNHYPVCPEPDQAMGLAAHTDSTMLTILHQSNIGGLQVFREESGWVTVEPIPGTLVVNIGDLFHILSNGELKSVVHRARVNQTRSRISMAYLYGPAGDVEIAPISKIVGPVGQSLYRPITWKEYLQIKYKVFDKAFDAIKVVKSAD